MSNADLIPVLLLISLSLSALVAIVVLLVVTHHRRKRGTVGSLRRSNEPDNLPVIPVPTWSPCPSAWLAIRSRNLQTVQSALNVTNPRPCRFIQGLAEEHRLFIAPPVRGWILVMGSGLPDITDDIDSLFRFIMRLSCKVGHVQFFSASRVLGYHAWIRAESGKVIRAYAWAGKTLWNQGPCSRAETELGLKSFDYIESPEPSLFDHPDPIAMNVDRVQALAARWSLDPAAIDGGTLERMCGIAGDPGRLY